MKIIRQNNRNGCLIRICLGELGDWSLCGTWIIVGQINCIKDFWEFIEVKEIPWIYGPLKSQKYAIIDKEGKRIVAHCGGLVRR